MARRFALVSFGILCLMLSGFVGFHWDADGASAKRKPDDVHTLGHNGWILDRMGQVWNINPTDCWERMPNYDIPVTLSDVALWDNHALLTTDGTAWRHNGTDGWINCGQWPGGPVPTSESTWGAIKEQYKGKDD